MNGFEASWSSRDGVELFLRGWQPEADVKAVVALLHGLGEHVGRYAHMAQPFTDGGYALVGFDLRGHGKSGGARGVIPSEEAVYDDISQFLQQTGQRYPGKPVFLYGHSLGANLSITYALKRKPALKGVIATGTSIRLAFEPPAWKVGLAKALGKVAPAFSLANGLERAALSRDPQVERLYSSDPLVHDRISTLLFLTIIREGDYCLEHASEFPLPLLLMHGGADRLTSAAASREFASKIDGRCTLKIWDGFYHEIHNEPEKDQVFQFTLHWLDTHLD